MLDGVPLPERGIIPKGPIYRIPGGPKREPKPEVLAIVQRVERAQIREYLKRRRAS